MDNFYGFMTHFRGCENAAISLKSNAMQIQGSFTDLWPDYIFHSQLPNME